ncbi:MAG: hypothetical protein ACYCZ2_17605 [Lutibacter sp.]
MYSSKESYRSPTLKVYLPIFRSTSFNVNLYLYHQKEIIRNKKYITITTKKQTLMKLTKLFFAAVIVLSTNASFGQDSKIATHLLNINIPEVALLDLEAPSTSITLAGTVPTEAGLPMTFEDATAKNTSIWMNYSSIVKGVLLRNVTVSILTGSVPAGLKLTVLAGAASLDGAGTKGTAASIITFINTTPTTPQNIVTGIGSTYTGNGVNKGRNLTYQLGYATDAETDYAALRNVDLVGVPLTITYTLSDI